MHLIVEGTTRAWNVFPAWDDGKKFEIFEMHTCLSPVAQICFRHKWRKLVTASLLLHCIDGYGCFRFWNDFFPAALQVLDWNFLVLRFGGKVCLRIPKVIWPRMDWFCGFLFKIGFFRLLHIFMDWKLKQNAQMFINLTSLNFFDVHLEG